MRRHMKAVFSKLILLSLSVHLTYAAASQTSASSVTSYTLKVEKSYTHDRNAYTQGLFFYGGDFYESTGQWGESSFRRVRLETGDVLSITNFPDDIFIEGSCVIGGYLFILTWKNHKCYMYDLASMTKLTEFRLSGEGWGLTTDGRNLIMSDGSSNLYFINPSSFTPMRSVKVTMNGKDVYMLNELEYINGRIWANVYTEDYIVIINPATGLVEGKIDCSGLLPRTLRTRETDVLNGIAYDSGDGSIYLTGKYWPRLYKVSLVTDNH